MMRIAVLAKQVPQAASLILGPDGRLVRDGLALEMNPYCRRAVAKGVELAQEDGAECVVITMGPSDAEDVLREAIAWGAHRGVLLSDPAFAGSDTLATARALAAALRSTGPWDLVLVGRNSVDADTGQVGPQVAELIGLPFVGGAKQLVRREGTELDVTSEYDDGWVHSVVPLPAVISCAERLCDPAKVPADRRRSVPAEQITWLRAVDLGSGPWGSEGSATAVGAVTSLEVSRSGRVLTGTLASQVAELADEIVDRLRTGVGERRSIDAVPPGRTTGPIVGVVVEPHRHRTSRELLGVASQIASRIEGSAVALTCGSSASPAHLAVAGADRIVELVGAEVEDDVAAALCKWAAASAPWAVIAPATLWGRIVLARAAARLGAGLTGDAIAVEVEGGRLVGWKPAFGGALIAAITISSDPQLVTIRPGALPELEPRARPAQVPIEQLEISPDGRIRRIATVRDDDIDVLRTARAVVAVGMGVPPERYGELDQLMTMLDAALGATRRVTDRGWLPRSRQIGITGASVAPEVFIALGSSGSFNHLCGARRAGLVAAINSDRSAPVFDQADVGIVGDWAAVVPALADRLINLGVANLALTNGRDGGRAQPADDDQA
jgi:electron transfer flavoprotein alpha subunit